MDIEHGYSLANTVSSKSETEGPSNSSSALRGFIDNYFEKFKEASKGQSPPRDPAYEAFIGLILGIIGILLAGSTDSYFVSKFSYDESSIQLLTGSYGSSAVLVYGVYDVPLAQPRNVIGSYVISSTIGVTSRIIGEYIGWSSWVTGAFAVGFTICAMSLTKTNHPPAGAVALIAVIGNERIQTMGYIYVLTSFCGSSLLVLFALFANNLFPSRKYPKFWW